jgi:RimJ/RimL family protein N-acetyltransferase
MLYGSLLTRDCRATLYATLPTRTCWRIDRWLSSAGLIILETERLRLRHLSPATDAGFILELLNEPSFIRYIGDKGTRNLDDARRYIVDGPVKSYREHGFGLYLVELTAGATPIGICGIIKRDTLPHADIGFAFLPAYWNQGYAFEAATAIMSYARNTLGLDSILAITTTDNEPSAKLLRKIGLRFDRMIRLSPGAPQIRLFTTDANK